jgi:hypothetical protein
LGGILIDSFTNPWSADASGLWAATSDAIAGRPGVSDDDVGMKIAASSGTAGSPLPFVHKTYSQPLDLSLWQELRFWFRSIRVGDTGPKSPFYLIFEAAGSTDPTTFSWSRLVAVTRSNTWELHRLWLGDMPAPLRQSVGSLRLRSLDVTLSFEGAMDALIAATPEPVQDVEAALIERLGKFELLIDASTVQVPALVDFPGESPSSDPPYVLITPWAIGPVTDAAGSGDVVDNFTTQGSFLRPPVRRLFLDYRVEVFTAERAHKTALLDRILQDLGARPWLASGNELFAVEPLSVSPEELVLTPPGRTPLFYRVTATMETGTRSFRPRATPFLVTGGEASAL